MLAVEEAVVGGVDQQGVVQLAGVAQGADDPLDALVDRRQRLGPAAVARVALAICSGSAPGGWRIPPACC